jgi:hypothetical protein
LLLVHAPKVERKLRGAKTPMEFLSPKRTSDYELQIKRSASAKSAPLRRFAIFLPWFARREIPMQIPLRSVAREFEELFHPFD